MSIPSESFGALLRQARLAAALTQEDLAERAGLTDRGIRYLERGLRRPNRDTVLRLVQALGLSGQERATFMAAAHPAPARAARALGPLRVPPYPLVGRERDVSSLQEQLLEPGGRLVTLTGPGGVGKTSLALVAAADVATSFPGGVTWVSLASLADPALLPTVVAHRLGLTQVSGPPVPELFRAALGEQATLLVLDNLEHLDAAGFVSDLLAACPRLTVLATSRSPLRIRAEREFPVLPLPTPPDLPGLPIHAVAASASVDLFLRRAQAVQPGFLLTEANAEAVAAVCRALDGLPLAIELAAARIRVLPPPAMLLRLTDRLAFLTGGPADLPPRQQAMRATVAWSHDLLNESHREVFAQLAIFDGGFGSTALEAVLPCDPITLLDAVEALHRSSLLLLVDTGDDDPRFRMLSTVRDFAVECLSRQGTAALLQERHAGYYLAFAEEATRGFYRPGSTHWLDQMEDDNANLRAALTWFLDRADVARGLRLCAALWSFWYVRGHATEGRAWSTAFLALPARACTHISPARAQTLLGVGQLAQTQGDYPASAEALAASIRLYRALGDQRSTAAALLAAGFTARVQEDYAAALDLLQQSLTVAKETGYSFVVAGALHHLGMIAADADHDLTTAERLLTESSTIYRSLGLARFIALLQLSIGDLAGRQQDHPRAHRLLTESLTGMSQAGEKLGIHGALDSLARLAADRGQWERAVTLAAAAERLRRASGNRSWPVVERQRSQWLQQAQHQLTHHQYSAAWAQGETLTPDETINYALNERTTH